MIVIKLDTPYELKEAMQKANRDYYSLFACKEIIDYYNDIDAVIDFDPVGISCEWEEDDIEDIMDKYPSIFGCEDDIPSINEAVDILNEYTYAVHTEDTSILYIAF